MRSEASTALRAVFNPAGAGEGLHHKEGGRRKEESMTLDIQAIPRHSQEPTLPRGMLGTGPGRHLVALDIDGTTVHHDGTLSARVRDAVRVAARRHEVVIATGRSVLAAIPVIEALGLRTGYAVCSNGAVTLRLDPAMENGWSVIDAQTFDPAPVLHALRDAFPLGGLAVERVGRGFDIHGHFPADELDGEVRQVSWQELFAEPTARVTFNDPETDVEAFTEHVGALGLHGVNYAIGFTAWLDITATGVSKAFALEAVRGRLGIESGRTVAVGDQRNDLEMLAWAGCGVAMGNAPNEVAEVADYVTGHVVDDGLADVLANLPRA